MSPVWKQSFNSNFSPAASRYFEGWRWWAKSSHRFSMTKKNRRIGFVFLSFLISVSIAGCGWKLKSTAPEEETLLIEKWSPDSYAHFVEENLKALNQTYSRDYAPVEFIVDRENGSARIQDLIDPATVNPIVGQLHTAGLPPSEAIRLLKNYVSTNFQFDRENRGWQTVTETIRAGRGDCKNLSLLLLSLLLAADVDARAAISNGHMWVTARDETGWQLLEVDDDPERREIYNIPGFYDTPLFRVYADRTEKRVRLSEQRGSIPPENSAGWPPSSGPVLPATTRGEATRPK